MPPKALDGYVALPCLRPRSTSMFFLVSVMSFLSYPNRRVTSAFMSEVSLSEMGPFVLVILDMPWYLRF
jgi:hypothetical protein